ncbi:hypothetical protein ADL26_19580, partial [Thermoactinomyces vulgaris]
GLDALTRKGVLDLLAGLKSKGGLTILLITHEPAVAEHLADRVLRIADGVAVPPQAKPLAARESEEATVLPRLQRAHMLDGSLTPICLAAVREQAEGDPRGTRDPHR